VTVSSLVTGLLSGENYSYYLDATNSVGGYDGSSSSANFTTLVNLGAVTFIGANLQFSFTSAPNAATSLTVWGTTNLTPPIVWQNFG
jgi:hypothetical protein